MKLEAPTTWIPRPILWAVCLWVGLSGLLSCIVRGELYFKDPAVAPEVSGLYVEGSPDVAFESGVLGGQVVILQGERLNGENLSVRFGDRAAEVQSHDIDPSGQSLSVLSPPGPLGGGLVDVTVAHDGGLTTLEDAYEYRLGDDGSPFAREAGSLELIGFSTSGLEATVRSSARFGGTASRLEPTPDSSDARLEPTPDSSDARLEPTPDSTDARLEPNADSTDARLEATPDSSDARLEPTPDSTDARLEATADSSDARLEPNADTSDAYQGALAFWPTYIPRQAGSLLRSGALFYYPGAPEAVLEWPVDTEPPPWGGSGTLPVAGEASLAPVGRSDVAPFLFLRQDSGAFELCDQVEGVSPLWIPDAEYKLTLSGGALGSAVTASLFSPPGIEYLGGLPDGLRIEDGAARINLDTALWLTFDPAGVSPADSSSFLIELVVEAPESSLPDRPYEIARVVAGGDDEAGSATLPQADIQNLPEVDSVCALLARELESARLNDSEEQDALEQAFQENDCTGMDDPISSYPFVATIRMTRHYQYEVPLPRGAAGCSSPGDCSGDASLVVDLVSALELPADIGHYPLSLCADQEDNDGDGLVDEEDPGCADQLDDSETDDTGTFVCDDGIDNDGDGLADYKASHLGDPGCSSVDDSSEVGFDACDDGKDNDGDGLVDYRPGGETTDPGCASADDSSENSSDLPCDNGTDDDGDGYSDYQLQPGDGDPGCSEAEDPNEKDSTGQYPCDDDVDNDKDGSIDEDDLGCRTSPTKPTYSPYEEDEFNPNAECDDGIDNDDDGGIDFGGGDGTVKDYECDSPTDPSESRN